MSTPSTKDPILADHLAWLGYVQPEGLVVSAPALVDSQVVIDRAALPDLQRRLAEHVSSLAITDSDTGDTVAGVADLPRFLTEFLGWPADLLVGWDVARPLPPELSVALPEFGETLAPTYAVTQPQSKVGASPWLLLVQSHPATVNLDKPASSHERGWAASPAKKFERLLRETQVPIGLLTNGRSFRLVYAPPKENSGALTFPVAAMAEITGRLILGAFHLLLNSWTLFTAPSTQRLPALLQRSRDYQASVSEILAEQVLHALYELLRGFESADGRAEGKLLRELAARQPSDIYGGLITVLLRLVFTLYAEDRGLMPGGAVYVRNYAVRGLFERLRADAERYPDTMDHRFGAWAQLLALFRLIYGGCAHPELTMPARKGHLFDPDRYPFLEGRAARTDPIGALPLVSDGTLHRILEKLCILEGERVSYRTLDVEEIGSVYQTIMGFGVETTAGTAIALKGKRKNGGVPASPVISLEQLLAIPAKDRAKWLKENADTDLTGEADKRLKTAATVDDLLVALEKRIDRHATPAPVAQGGLVLQPTDERRRSGSHYTPRSFTEPIVRKTLEPILKRFGEQPTPAQILELKICDIAVGSAAFLVETCRQLADVLVRAWRVHGGRPALPPDETEELLAMRTIAQRCLYGVDRNPMAVDLAKLSLWLATLAKDHPFTFLDHAIRCGDSLVGLTRRQIETFTWKTGFTTGQLWEQEVRKRTAAALRERQNLLGLGDDYGTPQLKREKLEKADKLLDLVRFIGDAAVAAFFAADKDKAREAKRAELAERIADYLGKHDMKLRPTDEVKALRGGKFLVTPFHWEIEYPEVFDRENPGFDAIVGNPPFLGGTRLEPSLGTEYRDWLVEQIAGGRRGLRGAADLCAYFYLHALSLLRQPATFGLLATNSIAQGDSRVVGLVPLIESGAQIYGAIRSMPWPGVAATHVAVVWISTAKNQSLQPLLDGQPVPYIGSTLTESEAAAQIEPLVLQSSSDIAFEGAKVAGIGFAIPSSEAEQLLASNPDVADVLFPYLIGDDVNQDPAQRPSRWVINFKEMPLARDDTTESASPTASDYPDALAIVEERVKPERLELSDATSWNRGLKKRWWQFGLWRPALDAAMQGKARVIIISRVTAHHCFTFAPTLTVFSDRLVVIARDDDASFALVSSRVHEFWAHRPGATTQGTTLNYFPTRAFATFPFPAGFETNAALEAAGREYYEFRAALMQDLWLGLTEIYNLFHSPDDEALARLEALYRKRAATPDWRTAETVPADRSPLTLYATPAAALTAVQRLRTLHAAMDTAVLTAYGWTDLLPKCTCEFLLDYEDEESDAEESAGRKKKKPWRYRWPDEIRDEVLARLLKLNADRAEEERLAGLAAAMSGTPKPKKSARKSKAGAGILSSQPDLLPPRQGDLFA